ncbi:MAG: aminoacyl-tRNA deacylase [Planctomycetota bacterium]|jgi:Ala-tRNA(Pro) deacylase
MRVEDFLKHSGVKFEKHEHPVIYTAQELAALEHVSGDRVAKSVVVEADGKTALCVLPASYKVDLEKLCAVLGARQCRLMDESEMAKLFPDVEVGAEGPFGGPYGLPTIVDERLAACETITFAADTHHSAIRMAYDDYARLAEPRVADVSAHL